MAEGQSAAMISVTVKSTKEKKTIEINEDADIKEVKRPSNSPHIPGTLR